MPHLQRAPQIVAHAAAASYTSRQVAKAYSCPVDQYDGTGATIGVIELGGSYSSADMLALERLVGLTNVPMVCVVPVDGAAPKSDGPNGADGEVMLDVEVIAAVAPGARQRVYFCPNTDAGFLNGIKRAVAECGLVSISWGGPEPSWEASTLDQFEAVLSAARARGVRVFVAAGDSGSRDGMKANAVDFPASSPSVVACGGTKLVLNAAGVRASEVTWDDSDTTSATGGGVSAHFPGRQVPDIAGNASPSTGYQVIMDGGRYVIGGTSAVAPLFAAMTAVLDQAYGRPWDFLNTVLTNPQVCFDVTAGDNGGFKAGPGRDNTTGYGVPDMGKVLAVLQSGAQVPAPGGGASPAPTPTPVPGPQPGSAFPAAEYETFRSAMDAYLGRTD